jgi:type II restriction enzyme
MQARRSGWIGCNILLQNIPESGKIYYIKNGQVEDKKNILKKWQKTLFLRDSYNYELKGWTLDVMRCIDLLGKKDFTLKELYLFEQILSQKYPDNKHIKDKIRQQLQFLRDKNYIKFVARGVYRLS